MWYNCVQARAGNEKCLGEINGGPTTRDLAASSLPLKSLVSNLRISTLHIWVCVRGVHADGDHLYKCASTACNPSFNRVLRRIACQRFAKDFNGNIVTAYFPVQTTLQARCLYLSHRPATTAPGYIQFQNVRWYYTSGLSPRYKQRKICIVACCHSKQSWVLYSIALELETEHIISI